ncbi:MAG: pentapeptide repeat-containing protein [Bacteriovoracia bacterium]
MFQRALGIALGAAVLWAPGAQAADQGFRYREGKCQNANGQAGLNPSYLGQCGDLRGTVLGRLNLNGIDFSGAQFTGADLQKSTFAQSNLTGANFDNAVLSGVEFDNTTLDGASFRKAGLKNLKVIETPFVRNDFSETDFRGTDLTDVVASASNFNKAVFSGAKLDAARFTDCKFVGADLSGVVGKDTAFPGTDFTDAKLGGAKLAGADLSRASFTRSLVDGADLARANATNAAFAGARLRHVALNGAKLTGARFEAADLHGANLMDCVLEQANFKQAIFSKRTQLPVTQAEAEKLGMVFRKAVAALILWDTLSDLVKDFGKHLNEQGVDATFSPNSEYLFDGKLSLAPYDVVIHFNGTTFSNDIPEAGQLALVAFVQAGGIFIHGEWNGYEIRFNNALKQMRDLSLFDLTDTTGDRKVVLTPEAGQEKHPLLEGVGAPLALNGVAGMRTGTVRTFAQDPVTVLMKDAAGIPAVVTRKFGAGKVVGFYFTCTLNGGTCLNLAPIRRLYLNAANL